MRAGRGVDVPSGLWALSFYDFNANGENATNWRRDYQLSLRAHPAEVPLNDVSQFEEWPELAHSRLHDFRGGVYKKFLVRGLQKLTIKVARNNSYNTILAGAFLDLVDEKPAPYFGSVAQWKKRQNTREQQTQELSAQSAVERAARFAPSTDEKEAANRLFTEIARLRDSNPLEWGKQSRPIYQALARVNTSPQPKMKNYSITILDTKGQLSSERGVSSYNLTLYNSWEDAQRQSGLLTARDIEKSLEWDGVSSDGEGFNVINQHLSSLPSAP